MQPPALMDLDPQIDPHQFSLNGDDDGGEDGTFFFPDDFARSYHVPQHFDGYDEYDHDDNPELREMADIQRRYSHANEPRMPQGLHDAHNFLNMPFDHLPNTAGMLCCSKFTSTCTHDVPRRAAVINRAPAGQL